MSRRLSLIAAILGVVGAVGLGGCEVIVAGGGAIYSAFHSPDPLAPAYVSLRRHDCSAADSEFSAFLDKEPNDPRAISGRADAMVCLEKYDLAIASYSRAIELEPKWFDYLGRGVAYKAQGDQSDAIRNFDEGIAIESSVPALYIYKGAVLSARGDASGAQA
jgi:tetratricopeptide (TPR) repeat protein